MAACPLLFPALVILAVAAYEWQRSRIVAAVALGSGFVLLSAALTHLEYSAQDFVSYGPAWLSVAVSVTRLLGAACFLWTVVRVLRTHQVPW